VVSQIKAHNELRAHKLRESGVSQQRKKNCSIGGLNVPIDPSLLSEYILIYIGDDSGYSNSRQFFNTILYCTSPKTRTRRCWSYNPMTNCLATDPFSNLGVSRFLSRRFYLTQKAKIANIIGILVGTLSQSRFRSVVSSVRTKVENAGRACYTFVVGKINVNKLANFAEVECFVLVSCGETSILSDERDFHVPIITPAELEIALGEKEWGGSASCNTNFLDFLESIPEKEGEALSLGNDDISLRNDSSECGESDDGGDEPVFSMISGTFISMSKNRTRQSKINDGCESNLALQPGGGQLIQYRSEAAEFLKQREYKGLDAQIGQKVAESATQGQTGIASDYGNR